MKDTRIQQQKRQYIIPDISRSISESHLDLVRRFLDVTGLELIIISRSETERANESIHGRHGEVIPLEKEILMEYADMKVEAKDLRRRIEKDRSQLWKLENSIVTDSVSRGKKGKKSLGSVKITGKPDGLIERKRQQLKRKIALQEQLEVELLEKQTQAEEFIQTIEKSELRTMLRFYFIDDLTYAQTAERMNALYPKRRIRYTDENVKKRIQRFFQNVPQCPIQKC